MIAAKSFVLYASACFVTTLVCAGAASAATLDTVKQRGMVQCGVSEGLNGFSEKSSQGEWSGFDVDFCRAVAGAIFNDKSKVTFVPLSAGRAVQCTARRARRPSVAQLDLDARAGGGPQARLRRHHLL